MAGHLHSLQMQMRVICICKEATEAFDGGQALGGCECRAGLGDWLGDELVVLAITRFGHRRRPRSAYDDVMSCDRADTG